MDGYIIGDYLSETGTGSQLQAPVNQQGSLTISSLLEQYYSPAGVDGGPSYVARRSNFLNAFDAGFGTVEAAVLDQTSRFSQNFWRRDDSWTNRIVPPADWSRIERT